MLFEGGGGLAGLKGSTKQLVHLFRGKTGVILLPNNVFNGCLLSSACTIVLRNKVSMKN